MLEACRDCLGVEHIEIGDAEVPPLEEAELLPLTVYVVGARGLKNADWLSLLGGSNDTYVSVHSTGVKPLNTKTIPHVLDPMWLQELEMNDHRLGQSLELRVFDKDPITGTTLLGQAVLESWRFEAEGYNNEIPLEGATHAFLRVKIKLAGKEYPKDLPFEYTPVIHKSKGSLLGIVVDVSDGTSAVVVAIKEGGLIWKYNETKAPKEQIKHGHYIKSVNGIKEPLKIVDALQTEEGDLRLDISRAVIFPVLLEKEPVHNSLQLGIDYDQQAAQLCIKCVETGPVTEWNIQHPDKAVKAGGRIVAVNGQQLVAKEMFKMVQDHKKLCLAISRPAEASSTIPWF